MDELPEEVLHQIFSTLTARDLLHGTCKETSKLICVQTQQIERALVIHHDNKLGVL